MHGTTLARTQGTRRASPGNLRTRTLKNRLARDGPARRGTHGACGSPGLRGGRDRTRRRSFVYRTRSRLRNNHARRRRLRRTCHCRRRRRTRRGCRRLRRSWSGDCRCWRRRWGRRRSRRARGRWNSLRRGGRRGSSGLLDGGRRHLRTRGRRRRCDRGCRRRRRRWRRLYRRRHYRGLGRNWRRCRPNRGCSRFLLLRDRLQHISRPGNMRQIDLGLDLFFAARRARGAGGRRLRLRRATDVGPYLFRFVLLERTGMGLLLRHSDDR
jgi:hypothetical protein